MTTSLLKAAVGVAVLIVLLVTVIVCCASKEEALLDDGHLAPMSNQIKTMRGKKRLEPVPATVGMPQTMNEAAVLALASAYTHGSHSYEYGGVIVKTPAGFNPSRPETDGHADNTSIDEDYERYEGDYPVVADYHTHPCLKGYVPGVFSPQDLSSMRASMRPGYILDECTGDVHYWAPGDGYTTDGLDPMEKLTGVKIASGKVVGHIPVDGNKLEL